ncbi:superoxide dismutase family protein [Aquimarina pacifica]|uniref:superoxide dismutase family protein n=1 Tax=Aquimarina pacifica TaxID=1296415 RepID=UPI00046F28E2|nr:superoxide dismutase family protein [Aquimarina pacifica]
MKTLKTTILIGVIGLATIVSCKKEKKEVEVIKKEDIIESVKAAAEEKIEKAKKKLSITLEPKNDSNITGSITFTETEGIVNMVAEVKGLAEGEHAIHIHEKADCSSADGKSTGGHWNPGLTPHGKWGAKEGYHKGDIGNFKTDASGIGNITFATNEWCLGCDDEKKNIIGKAIIVHQGTDDFTSQPSGAAGSRVSCGAIIQ